MVPRLTWRLESYRKFDGVRSRDLVLQGSLSRGIALGGNHSSDAVSLNYYIPTHQRSSEDDVTPRRNLKGLLLMRKPPCEECKNS